MGKWVHRLSNYDEATKTAYCSNCGPVEVVVNTKNKRCRNASQASKITYKYGITVTSDHLKDKPDCCPLCQRDAPLVFDHCHTAGTFRGWICLQCNLALGYVRDDPETLRRMARYLEG